MKKPRLFISWILVASLVHLPGLASADIGWRKGQELPDIIFGTIEGDVHSISDFRGKVLFVNFWATWCDPCIREWPMINHLIETLDGEFTNADFILLNMFERYQKGVRWTKRRGYTVALYDSYNTGERNDGLRHKDGSSIDYGPRVIPTSLVVNGEGIITKVYRGQKPTVRSVRKAFLKAGGN